MVDHQRAGCERALKSFGVAMEPTRNRTTEIGLGDFDRTGAVVSALERSLVTRNRPALAQPADNAKLLLVRLTHTRR